MSKDRPILFTPANAQLVHNSKKTQTRRIVKPQPHDDWTLWFYHPLKVDRHGEEYPGHATFGLFGDDWDIPCPYGTVGDRLWVRHAVWKPLHVVTINDHVWNPITHECLWPDGTVVADVCGVDEDHWKKVPSLYMPKWACRTWLELIGLRVEKLGDLTGDDARAEGVNGVAEFVELWKSINKTWEPSLWVWALTFRTVHRMCAVPLDTGPRWA